MVTCVTVFFTELFIMFFLSFLKLEAPAVIRAFLDSLLLIAILLPILYHFLYRPVFRCIGEVIEKQEEIIREKCRLELNVKDRTSNLEQQVEKCSRELVAARLELLSRGAGEPKEQ
jgi:hypothetical protein